MTLNFRWIGSAIVEVSLKSYECLLNSFMHTLRVEMLVIVKTKLLACFSD